VLALLVDDGDFGVDRERAGRHVDAVNILPVDCGRWTIVPLVAASPTALMRVCCR
jgi:hypothetical protein